MDEFYEKFGLTEVINVIGPRTTLGSSEVIEKVRKDISDMLGRSVEMWELQRRASEAIVRLTGAEAGCVVGCSAAGIAVATAAVLTKGNMGWVKALPTVLGPKNRIAIQKGHMISLGESPMSQVVRMTGAEVVEVGEALECSRFYLETALTADVAAAVYVAGDQFSPQLLSLESFIRICKLKDVPVIIDAAYITDFRFLHKLGADLVVHSAQKWIGGATAGIIAGKRDLVHACYMNDMGIGRPMKAGKEGILGVISAINSWLERDEQAIFDAQMELFNKFQERISLIPGFSVDIIKGSMNSPSQQLILTVDSEVAGIAAWEILYKFERNNPVIKVGDASYRGKMIINLASLDDRKAKVIIDTIERIIEDKRNNVNVIKERPEQLTNLDALYEKHSKWLDENPRL